MEMLWLLLLVVVVLMYGSVCLGGWSMVWMGFVLVVRRSVVVPVGP